MRAVTKGTWAGGSFEAWMREVDREVGLLVGLSYLDLPDLAYRDMYESGKSAKAAAKKAVRNAGGEM